MNERRVGILLRIRGALLGRRGTAATSALAEAGRRSPGYLTPDPGPFDAPPAEPVVLDPAASPWELSAAEGRAGDETYERSRRVRFHEFERSVAVGAGEHAFLAARAAILAWGLQSGSGIEVLEAPPEVRVGATARLRIRLGPIRVNAPVRVTEVVEAPRRAGFVYETLPGHPEDGAESFIVEWQPDDTVRVVIAARSRHGRWFTKLGAPFARIVQRRATEGYFDAARAAAVAGPPPPRLST
jgi:uncharacterized protein (UPF0548 family)